MASLAVRTPAPTSATPTPARTIIDLGMDVHKDSIILAVLPGAAKTPTPLERLRNDLVTRKKWFDRIATQGELRAGSEASGAGFVLHRALREWGDVREVIAPSLIPTRPGVPRKQDNRDALPCGARRWRLRCPSADEPLAHVLPPRRQHDRMDLQRRRDRLDLQARLLTQPIGGQLTLVIVLVQLSWSRSWHV